MLPPKKDVAIALLEGPSVFVHLDPRREGVVVPKWFKNQPQLVLQIGLNMAVRIPDLDVGDEGIGCTLSFQRTPHWCFMPWSAIYGLVGEDGRSMIWPEDVPRELVQQKRPKLEAVRAEPVREPRKRKLREVPAEPDEPTPQPLPDAHPLALIQEPEETGKKKKLPPYLRVVK